MSLDESVAHVSVLTLELHIPESRSLKDKRRVLKSLRDKLANTFNISHAEVGLQDKWQTTILALAMVSSDSKRLDSSAEKILSFISDFPGVRIIQSRLELG